MLYFSMLSAEKYLNLINWDSLLSSQFLFFLGVHWIHAAEGKDVQKGGRLKENIWLAAKFIQTQNAHSIQ